MSLFSDNVDKRAQELVNRLQKISDRIDTIIKDVVTTTETSNRYWNGIQVEIRKLYEDARKIASNWTNKNIPIVYREQIRRQITKLKASRFDVKNSIDYRSFVSTNKAKQSLAALLGEINSTWYAGFTSGEKTLLRLTRLTQQLRVRESEIEKSISKGFIEGGPGVRTGEPVGKGSLYGINRELITKLTKSAVDGKYITLIDKNGKEEHWNIKTYSELVARTKLVESSTQAVINTTVAMGEDLVQVSVHNTNCKICVQFEGKIFSLSGRDSDFPPAEDLPPYHPHCYHILSTVIKNGLIADGTLNAYKAFSKGETEIHPTRKGWIPPNQRKLV